MQNVEIGFLLDEIGWSHSEFARRINVNNNTVSRWVTGKSGVPQIVIMYLELVCEVRRLGA